MNERLAVNHQKAVVEEFAFLHGEQIRVLRVELLNVHVWQETFAAFASDNENLHTRTLLRDERENGIIEVRIDDDQLRLRHAHELLHLLERIINLPIEKHFLRRKFLILHRVKN